MSTPTAPTVADLLDAVGQGMVTVRTAPHGTSQSVRSITLPDSGPGLGAAADSLHLAVSPHSGGGDIERIIEACERVGAAGVVVRPSTCSADLLASLLQRDLVTLQIEDRLSWPALFGALSSALAGLGEVRSVIAPEVRIGDLFGLVNSIASVVGGATAVEDVNRQVLAYSTHADQEIDDVRMQGILGRHVPNFPGNEATYQAMWRSPRAIRVASGYPGHRPRICVAVRVGLEPLGSIWVVEGDQLVGDALVALDQAAAVVAVHLLHLREGVGPTNTESARVIARVLEGAAQPAELRTLGMNPRSRFGVIAFELTENMTRVAVERLAGIAQFAWNEGNAVIACLVKVDLVLALVSSDTPLDPGQLRQIATTVSIRARSAMGLNIRAAYRAVDGHLADIPNAVQDVESALRLLGAEDPGRTIVGCDELEATLYLSRLRDQCANIASPHADVLTAIADYDVEHGSSYLETLRGYLRRNGDMALTSQELMVHRNTLRYRITRLEQLFLVDLSDPDERLVLNLQMRLRDL